MLTRRQNSGKQVVIYPIKAFTDNYIWAIHNANNNRVCIVDPGDSQPVLDYIKKNQLILDSILVTHYHNDHIGGVEELKSKTDCKVYTSVHDQLKFADCELEAGDNINIFDSELNFRVFHIPGHTLGHIAYYEEQNNLLFCGDTLFRAGCGRMFEGTPTQFYDSLQQLATLPPKTKIYCTHEYTLSNLAFAQHIEPDNQQVLNLTLQCQQLREQNQATLPSTIASELATNPFLRCNIEAVKQRAQVLSGKNSDTPERTFATIRHLKDNF